MSSTIDTYEDAVDFLLGRVNFERIPGKRHALRNVKLERTALLLEGSGDPQNTIPAVHIGGTKGKGSTAVMTAAILSAAGARTGLFTSPHIDCFEERIQIDGVPIGRSEFTRAVAAVADVATSQRFESQSLRPTFFELLTAAAWFAFRQVGVEIAVIEVGLGGRLDATNVCRPVVTAITNVSLDHTELLGDTVEKIASEKAGIAKPGVPMITSAIEPALSVIRERCRSIGAPLAIIEPTVGNDQLESSKESPDWHRTIAIRPSGEDWGTHRLPLPGRFQCTNAAVAAELAAAVAKSGQLRPEVARAIGSEAVRKGWSAVDWPARLEIVRTQPTFIIDAAHNDESIRVMLEALRERPEGGTRVAIFGTSTDKNATAMLGRLSGEFADIVLTTAPNNPRAAGLHTLRNIASETTPTRVNFHERATIVDAAELAVTLAGEAGLVCCAGSIYLAAAMRTAMLSRSDSDAARR
ncbi:bifunctional folylpolyglutamate synthase/dihydrofolate synthase [Stratiformator vulcanicus]|uniref:Dihydrofolate synthase/folylpolyglutamate synthase n=1 Tax=Stratiformator vulcanicus TaxID=2527980 RepID=A0A517R041_9PLAN|nr:folylpolyglutamate synthase/dihydrofolate synthase family protein [Stratiformator vulcanicus]QDT37266.1 Folylpolyglutamate synthase [Stratiformator vulcanicus]